MSAAERSRTSRVVLVTGGNRGMVMFIVFTTGLALIGAGWAMARGRRVLH